MVPITYYGRLAAFFYFSITHQITHCYSDGLGNSSMKLMPATIGSDIELRCTKVLERQYGESMQIAACTDGTKLGCGHIWSKNGTKLNDYTAHVDKFVFSNKTTVGYCPTFRDTISAFNTFGFTDQSHGRFKCLVSSMKIKNVSVHDFGVYTCNFSSHYEEVWIDPAIDQTEVVQAGTRDQLKEVIYFDKSDQKSENEMLIQCVVTGGNARWLLIPQKSEYNYDCSYSDCPEEYIPLNTVNTTDYWRCYKMSVIYMNPYENVSVSLIGIKNMCPSDNDVILCTVNGHVQYLSEKWQKRFYITKRNDGLYYRYYSIYNTDEFWISLICVPVILGVLFIVFVVLAMIRSKGSNIFRGTTQYSLTLVAQQQWTQAQPNYTTAG